MKLDLTTRIVHSRRLDPTQLAEVPMNRGVSGNGGFVQRMKKAVGAGVGWFLLVGNTLPILIIVGLATSVSVQAGLIVVAVLVVLCFAVYVPGPTRERANLLALVAGAVAYAVAPQRISEIGFYELAAQVVPALFVALAIDAQGFSLRPGREDIDRRVAVIVAVYLAVAGFESLRVLASKQAEQGQFKAVVAALVIATTGLVIRAATGSARETNASEANKDAKPKAEASP